ncbi:kelch-like protein diablo isoform X1 [Eurosta solidaginis]|uniref:kelch-like protein diablo isoform X1 n=1 Tax=Eurosta solidaginis TaxID=178769 RepID=UPI003530A6D3
MVVYVIVKVHETLTYVASIDSRAIESATRLLADITASNIKLVYIGRGVKRPRNTNPKAEIENCITFRRYLQTKLQFHVIDAVWGWASAPLRLAANRMGDPMLPGTGGSAGASTGAIDRPPSPARLSHTSEKHPKVTLSELNMLRRHRELCDVVLNVGGHKIFAHRAILSACSPYFRAMFTGELEESRQTEVTIRDIDEYAMELLIDFCYTAHIIVEESNE